MTSIVVSSIPSTLEAICTRYKSWDDSLSRRILQWHREVKEIRHDSPDDMMALVMKVEELATEILINPITSCLLAEPMLQNHWVFENWMLQECKEFLTVSPFNQKPMVATAKVHLFAKEMLQWLASMQGEFSFGIKETLEPLTAEQRTDQATILDRCELYKEGALQFREKAKLREEREKFSMQLRSVAEVEQEATDAVARVEAKLSELQLEQQRRIQEGISRLLDIYAITDRKTQEGIAEEEKSGYTAASKLYETDLKLAKRAQEVRSLKSIIYRLRQQL